MEKGKKDKDRIKEQQVTYDVYAAMPDDGQRYEIFDGALEMMSPGPSRNHQTVGGELEFILKQSCRSDYLIYDAPFDVILSERNVLQPDIMMIQRSRQHIVTMRGIEGPPDLVVEIISPGSRKRDRIKKMSIYAKHSILEYWVVDSDARTLEQYRLAGEKYELHNLYEENERVTSDKLP
ncbi:MAG: Uma2 family endonuclease, partial [Paenibacillus sp.]|nr:Uma2 family endonuclease [Paenibacillus sp.]